MHFLGRVTLPVIVAVAVAYPFAGRAEVAPPPDLLDNPNVMAAIRTAFAESANGRSGIEASFRLDGSLSWYRIVVTPLTNQFRRQSVELIPGVTFAIFHVHTAKGDPPPSPEDRKIADRHNLKIYTIHARGIYVYDPATSRTTKLREGVKWMNSEQKTSTGARRVMEARD